MPCGASVRKATDVRLVGTVNGIARAAASQGATLKLVVLGVFFTALPQTLFTSSHTHLKAKTVSIIATLLPVYGPLFAVFALGEIPTMRTLVGGAIVVGAVVTETLRQFRRG